MKKKKKFIMQAKDKFKLFKILHLFVKMIFNYERHCMQLVLLMQLAGITGKLPNTFISICYNNIKITLLLDSYRKKSLQSLIESIFKNTKRYLTKKKNVCIFFYCLFVIQGYLT